MTDTQMLTSLKTDLGITVDAYDARLAELLKEATAAIIAEGAVDYDPSVEFADAQLTIIYARWLWSCRDTMVEMPRMLRWKLNNRVFGGQMA